MFENLTDTQNSLLYFTVPWNVLHFFHYCNMEANIEPSWKVRYLAPVNCNYNYHCCSRMEVSAHDT